MTSDEEILEQINSCLDCKACMDACDTFLVTQNEQQSPNGRLKIAGKLFENDEISEDGINSLYTCTLCAACNLVCVQSIKISDIVHASKVRLVQSDRGPLSAHKKIIQGIIDDGNSVGGKPKNRLDWLPEPFRESEQFEEKESDTLLFFGCMSSFRVKESASAPYQILRKAGFNFKILKNEPCCGEYVYSAGKLDLAKKMFRENINLFKKLGVKNLVVTCGGCLYAFSHLYPKYFEDFNITVNHVVDVIYELANTNKLQLTPLNKSITYHDPCRLGRKYEDGPLFNEPRDLFKKCGIDVKEFTDEHENCPCCGSGSGIRGVDSSICIRIGKELFKKVQTKEIVSSCPLCVFNFRYVNYKNQSGKESIYMTDYILESMNKTEEESN
ncbi:MAG: (Fe-S)-binding protein [Promethearchaeota archaeon]